MMRSSTGIPKALVGWVLQSARTIPSRTRWTGALVYSYSSGLFLRALVLLLLVNFRSFPLFWHFRVIRHLAWWNFRRLISPNQHKYIKATSPIGKNPFEVVIILNEWAGPDDCDFLGHLSNSAYAKILDEARMKLCIENLRPFMMAGGWMPLAGADYAYVAEIPILSRYQIRTRVAGFDNKWVYVHSEFITTPGGPKNAPPGTVTATTKCLSSSTLSHSTRPATQRLKVREDGTVLHCIAISRYCFKMGSLTVPPAVALGTCGFGTGAANWARSAGLQQAGKLRNFLRGGWRDHNLDLSDFEEARVAGMEWCNKLVDGISGATWRPSSQVADC
ncbi:hypothetical protein DFH07DRAFT_856206 [Mycena maculata]|uniref:Uncharacterized protein n=1 Tax=Mycena maculata TaxID=230809 RepID=A0AAD7HL39_9AGAR|nr:hypothetical protein DFH07DRAFT_856206 [Mycena maculata]